jgi:hypothetical protein
MQAAPPALKPRRHSGVLQSRHSIPPPSRCSGTLSYPEFERLLATLEQWTNLFQSADKDRSGKLSIAGEGRSNRRQLHSLGCLCWMVHSHRLWARPLTACTRLHS